MKCLVAPHLQYFADFISRDSGKRFSSAPCRDVFFARRTGRVEQLAAGNNDTIDSEDFELRLQQRRRGQ